MSALGNFGTYCEKSDDDSAIDERVLFCNYAPDFDFFTSIIKILNGEVAYVEKVQVWFNKSIQVDQFITS